ncbi:MAG: preprotein translocase subunit SecG [Bacteroidales bacterium]|nr:preprotein translocase subunit SecG [Bacteroidales bacterium]MBN2761500.1 preprotein translocase subunit SecG [Bacteroidales bacterium]
MYGLIIGIVLFLSILLILVILVQNPKGGGLASGFSSSNQIMGVKRTADFIEKATWGFASAIVALSIIATMFINRNKETGIQTKIQNIENAIPADQMPTYPTNIPGEE